MRKLPIIFIFLAALMIASCRSSKSEMTHRAKENLEASLDYPKQLKIIAHSQPDSAFGVTYFTRNEITGMLKVMAVVTKQLMAKTKDISDISNSDAALLASIFSLISIPFSMTVPSLTTRLSDGHRRIMLAIISIAGMMGIAMLLYPSDNFLYWLVAHLLIGTACSALFPYLMVCFSLKTSSPEKTAQLSGLAQTGGYILAAFGPTLFGYSFDLFQSWIPAVLTLLAIDIIMTISLFMVDRADKIL